MSGHVNAVIVLVVPLDGVEPDALDTEKREAAMELYDRLEFPRGFENVVASVGTEVP